MLEVVLPPKFDYSVDFEEQIPAEPIKGTAVKMRTVKEMEVGSSISRIRVMPQNASFTALRLDSPNVEIHSISKPTEHSAQGTEKVSMDDFEPIVELDGHSKSGWGLDWSKLNEGSLVTGADDDLICVWDIHNMTSRSKGSETASVKPVHSISGHQGNVNDVAWSCCEADLFASVSDDMTLCVWDKRALSGSSGTNKPSSRVIAHSDEIYSVGWSPFSSKWIATASLDTNICLWDTRNLKSPVHKLSGHQKGINSLVWSPSEPGVLVSSGQDRRVFIWDITRTDRSVESSSEPPAELLFIHGGHMAAVSEAQWSPNFNWLVASVDDNSCCHVWEMAEPIRQEGSQDTGPRFFRSDFSSTE
jgi:histone-binding protein RBBP4